MKKFLVIMLAMIMALCLFTACGDKVKEPSEPTEEPTLEIVDITEEPLESPTEEVSPEETPVGDAE